MRNTSGAGQPIHGAVGDLDGHVADDGATSDAFAGPVMHTMILIGMPL
jgi:hypothetical protein